MLSRSLAIFVLALVLKWSTAFASAPVITSFAPTNGVPGTSVSIFGSDLASVTSVQFNLASAIISSISSSRIVATVPADATTGPISVNTSDGSMAVSPVYFTVAPRITDLSPNNGAVGLNVVITGANFAGATAVEFNGVQAAFAITADTQIQAVVPDRASSGPVTVITPAGTATTTNLFIVTGSGPVITGFSPTNGAAGVSVVISGGNFTGVGKVLFNGTNASFGVSSDTQIHALVPANATTGPITVISSAGTNTSRQAFVVNRPGPVVTSFSPPQGSPGTIVVISGLNFSGATSVLFNGTNAVFGLSSDTQIQATVPNGATPGLITVVTPLGTNASQTAFVVTGPEPMISGFSPTFGSARASVTISGLHFSSASQVLFNGTIAAFGVSSDTQIHAVVPSGALSGPITVITPFGTNRSASSFNVSGPGPNIIGFTPGSGSPGTRILIAGANFAPATAVLLNGIPAQFGITSDTQIQATVPPGATTGPLTVATPNGTNTTTAIFFVSPLINGFVPTNGVAGAKVVIAGANFYGATSVKFDGVNASFTISSATNILATVPSNVTSGAITVMTPAGIVASIDTFHVLPRIDSFSPLAGPVGTAVTILGSGLAGATGLIFGGLEVPFSVVSPNEITTSVPLGASNGPIRVLTPEGTTISTNNFTVSISGDMAVFLTASPVPVTVGSNLNYTITVTNKGPSGVTRVTLKAVLPAAASLVSIGPTTAACTVTNGVVYCNWGSLTNQAAQSIQIVVKPMVAALLTNTVTVSAQEFDPSLGDNTATVITTAVGQTTPALQIRLRANSTVELTWPSAITNFTLQAAAKLSATWVQVTNVPVVIGSRTTVTVQSGGATSFYRLIGR